LPSIFSTHKPDGISLYWDDKTLFDVPYDGITKEYFCGKELKVKSLNHPKHCYILITMDTNECTIGMLSGKRITTLWTKKSYIQGKHKTGGQSAQRFERLRNEAIKQWFKKIAQKLTTFK